MGVILKTIYQYSVVLKVFTKEGVFLILSLKKHYYPKSRFHPTTPTVGTPLPNPPAGYSSSAQSSCRRSLLQPAKPSPATLSPAGDSLSQTDSGCRIKLFSIQYIFPFWFL